MDIVTEQTFARARFVEVRDSLERTIFQANCLMQTMKGIGKLDIDRLLGLVDAKGGSVPLVRMGLDDICRMLCAMEATIHTMNIGASVALGVALSAGPQMPPATPEVNGSARNPFAPKRGEC